MNFNDLQRASLVSRQWYAISQHPSMVEKSKIFIKTEIQIIRILESKKYLKNLIFGYNPINPNSSDGLRIYNKFWKDNSENIQYVCLDGITNLNLIFQALFKLPNLKTLEFRNCKNFEDVIFDKPAELNISSLLMGPDPQYEYMEDGEMSYILSVIPKLERLQITSTKMEKCILRYIQSPDWAASLKYLNLQFIAGEYHEHIKKFLLKIIKIEHLNLEYLKFKFHPKDLKFSSTEKTEIVKFFATQKNLETLKFESPGFILHYDRLFRQLLKLKSIRIEVKSESETSSVCENLLENLKKFWKLKGLEMTFKCNTFPFEFPIFDALTGPSSIEHLHLFSKNNNFDYLMSRMHFLPMLSCLRLESCDFKNDFVQGICKNLLSLKELRLQDCMATQGLTDYGLTGEVVEESMEEPTDTIGYSISRLTGLEILCIGSRSSTKLTDLSLEHLAELKHLKKLCLDLHNKVCFYNFVAFLFLFNYFFLLIVY